MASNGEKEVMKKSRFTEEQMVTILREADKAPIAEVAKKYGISDPDHIQLATAFRRATVCPPTSAGPRSCSNASRRSIIHIAS